MTLYSQNPKVIRLPFPSLLFPFLSSSFLCSIPLPSFLLFFPLLSPILSSFLLIPPPTTHILIILPEKSSVPFEPICTPATHYTKTIDDNFVLKTFLGKLKAFLFAMTTLHHIFFVHIYKTLYHHFQIIHLYIHTYTKDFTRLVPILFPLTNDKIIPTFLPKFKMHASLLL